MNKTRSYKPRPDKHRVIPGDEADKECPVVGGFIGINCEDCNGRYIVHCESCKQQVSHCSCTLPELIKKQDKARREENEKEQWMKKKGMWTPPGQMREP